MPSADSFTVTQIEPDIFVFRGNAYESIATVFVHGRHALLVDALASAADAQRMRAHIETTLGASVRLIVMTHAMSDHMSGLHLFPDAHVLAHAFHDFTFLSQRERSIEDEREFVRPTIEIQGEVMFAWGRNRLRVFHNPGKTMCALAVDVPDRDLVVCGDAIVGNIAYLSSSAPDLIDRAIQSLQRLGRSRVIPGHIGPQDASALGNARSYLRELGRCVGAKRDAHCGTDSIFGIAIETCLAEGVTPTPFEREWHARNLDRIVERGLYRSREPLAAVAPC